ncbi:hypothetical protein NEUTE2DRAFT_131009 [Neurospora tetrasperma FGSC 2509]|nr:hypothetical protein NEUTE2DRAFT_131009 [Neurospora tetrasperma FGSC 2509]
MGLAWSLILVIDVATLLTLKLHFGKKKSRDNGISTNEGNAWRMPQWKSKRDMAQNDKARLSK